MSFRAGHVAVIGRPNVGKSTLVNALVGQKVSIVAPRPQTTRHRILGIASGADHQLALIDSPGLHSGGKRALNRALNRTAQSVLAEADVVLMVSDAQRWTDEDENALTLALRAGTPLVLALNKIDRLDGMSKLLPKMAALGEREGIAAVVPISARLRDGLDPLRAALIERLPVQPAMYETDAVTDRSERFLSAELIREQLTRILRDELPYSLSVSVDQFKLDGALTRIDATIWVERDSQKGIVIGAGGANLKTVGSAARQAIERMLDGKVFLALNVRVRDSWADDERALRALGIGE